MSALPKPGALDPLSIFIAPKSLQGGWTALTLQIRKWKAQRIYTKGKR